MESTLYIKYTHNSSAAFRESHVYVDHFFFSFSIVLLPLPVDESSAQHVNM